MNRFTLHLLPASSIPTIITSYGRRAAFNMSVVLFITSADSLDG